MWPTPLSKLHPTHAINNLLTLNSIYTVVMLSTRRTSTLWNIPLYIQRFCYLEEEGTILPPVAIPLASAAFGPMVSLKS